MPKVFIAAAVGPFHPGVAVTNTFTTKRDVSPAPTPIVLPGTMDAGTKIQLYAHGHYSTTGTPTLTMGFWFGTRALVITGDVAVSSVITTATATAWPWRMEWEGICTAPGVAGTLVGQGQLKLGSSLIAFNAETPIPITAALRTVTIDTTIERAFGVSAAFSASSASNEVGCSQMELIIPN